jgi:hypothetical protein
MRRCVHLTLLLALGLAVLAHAFDPVRNFGVCQVSTGYDAAATSIVAVTGCAAKLPSPASEGAFNLVWWEASTYATPSDDPKREVVRVTALTGETLTIVRAQEGTAAQTHNTTGKTYRLTLAPTKKLVDDLNRAGTITFAGGETSATVTGLTGLGSATYRVHTDQTWNAQVWILEADKTTSQFVVRFGNPPSAGDKLRWWLLP